MKPQPIGAASAATALFVSLLWGGNVAALKLGLETFPTFWSAFWRFLGAAVAVYLWAKFQRVRLLPDRTEWGPLAILAVLFATQISCLNISTGWTSAGYAVVLINTHPVFTNVLGQFVAGEDRLNWRRGIGLGVAFAGICWLALGRPEQRLAPAPIPGNLLAVLSGALLAARVLYTRRIVQVTHPLKPVLWQMLLALPAFAGTAWLMGEAPTLGPVTWEPVAAILYQGPIVGGVCFVVWTTLLKRHSASTLSIFGFTVPIFGVILSALMFDEAIGARLVGGAALVTVGIFIVTRATKPAVETAAPRREPQGVAR